MPRGRCERTLRVSFVGGPTFEGWTAKHVFVEAIEHVSETVGLEKAYRHGCTWIQEEEPEKWKDFLLFGRLWVRTHGSLNDFVGHLTELKEVGVALEVGVRGRGGAAEAVLS
jgi:hypothetical protein